MDVVVAGGGPAGVMAAVAAARTGAATMLLESNGYFGGVATMGLPLQGYYDREGQLIARGLAQEFVKRLQSAGGALPEFTQCTLHNPYLIIDPEIVKTVLLDMIEEAKIEPYLHSWVAGTVVKQNRIEAIIVENKSGREAVTAKAYIDATGDGDVASRSGASFNVGRLKDNLTQSATLNFRVDGVDTALLCRNIVKHPQRYDIHKMLSRNQFQADGKHIMVGLRNIIDEARNKGFKDLPCDFVNYITLIPEGAVSLNMVHVKKVYGHEARDLTRAEIEGRRQIPIILNFLRRFVPGFEKAQLTSTANRIGIRETRHILGDYILTVEDIMAGTQFSDTIAVGGYMIDIHSPTAGDVELVKVPPYGIPYRCLTPKGLDNLLVTGRCISATHEALASARQMATCMAMGHAAGVAAALAAKQCCSTREIAVDHLQKVLKEQDAYIF